MTWLLVLACAQSAYYMLLTTSLSDRKSLLAWTKYWFSYFAVELRHINVVLVKSRTDFNRMLALSSVVGVFMSVLSILLGKNNFENLIFLLFMHIFIFETLTTLLNILCKPRKSELLELTLTAGGSLAETWGPEFGEQSQSSPGISCF